MLSRLWYLVLALAVGGALAGAFLNKSAASREVEFQLEEQLRRDRVEAELWILEHRDYSSVSSDCSSWDGRQTPTAY